MADKPYVSASKLHLSTIIKYYSAVQKEVQNQIASLATDTSAVNPAKFLLMQFKMAYVTQVGDSVSNLVSQINSMINNAVRNQKGQ